MHGERCRAVAILGAPRCSAAAWRLRGGVALTSSCGDESHCAASSRSRAAIASSGGGPRLRTPSERPTSTDSSSRSACVSTDLPGAPSWASWESWASSAWARAPRRAPRASARAGARMRSQQRATEAGVGGRRPSGSVGVRARPSAVRAVRAAAREAAHLRMHALGTACYQLRGRGSKAGGGSGAGGAAGGAAVRPRGKRERVRARRRTREEG